MVADRSALAGIDGLTVPRGLRPVVEEIVALTDEFCAEHLDAEYARLCAALLAKLSRKRPSPLLRGVLYGIRTFDGVSYAGVVILFLVVALVAAFVPARRTAAVDPGVALRYE